MMNDPLVVEVPVQEPAQVHEVTMLQRLLVVQSLMMFCLELEQDVHDQDQG
jgi:hypothetical protein